jgi:hypothetical protein
MRLMPAAHAVAMRPRKVPLKTMGCGDVRKTRAPPANHRLPVCHGLGPIGRSSSLWPVPALPAVPRDLRRMAAKVQKSRPGQPYEDRGAVRIPRSPGRSENRAHVQGRTSGCIRHARRAHRRDAGPTRVRPRQSTEAARGVAGAARISSGHEPAMASQDRDQRPQSSSTSRCTAAQAGFFDLSQSGERPER